MQQHPIPQNVTQYQFKLIGFLTLSQFAFLGGFLLLAFLVYKSPLPFFFKWPIAALFALGGILFTFFKFNERPFHIYVLNFIKSIYGPTQYLWKKEEKIPEFFTFTRKVVNRNQTTSQNHVNQQKFQNYLSSLNPKPQIKPQDEIEVKNLAKIDRLFGDTKNIKAVKQAQTTQNPLPAGDKPRSIKQVPDRQTIETVLFQNQVKLGQKNIEIKNEQQQKQIVKNVLNSKPMPLTKLNTLTPTHNKPNNPPPKSTQKANQNTSQTQQLNTTMNNTNKNQPPIIKPAPSLAPPVKVTSLYPEKNTPKTTIAPQFLSDINMPITPEAPNIIVGMTVTKTDKLIPNAIVEIQDSNNMPIRAVKSNRLAQFFIATPIKNGEYQIIAEHPSFKFDTIKIEAKGEIIPPIKIVATA